MRIRIPTQTLLHKWRVGTAETSGSCDGGDSLSNRYRTITYQNKIYAAVPWYGHEYA